MIAKARPRRAEASEAPPGDLILSITIEEQE